MDNLLHGESHSHSSSMDSSEMNHEEMNHEEMNHEEMHENVTSILSVPDLNGDGNIDNADMRDIISRYEAVDGDDLYHPLYDLNANGEIDNDDLESVIHALGSDVPLLDQQIAQATQATMKYYGSNGQEQAIADGYIPFTQEALGHGIHYYNPTLALEIGNLEELDIERPIGLNYDIEGNLAAVFYIRIPNTLEATPENPTAAIMFDPADDFPPFSFDTQTAEDWHTHERASITGVGNLNSELVSFEEDIPLETIASRLQQTNFQLFPESDRFYLPKFWMMHGWFHSFNSVGTFALTNPDLAIYGAEELGTHSEHEHQHGTEEQSPLVVGTDAEEGLFGTDEDDIINLLGGDDWVIGGLGDDRIFGGDGNDWLAGDDLNLSEAGDDLLYGGLGNDAIYGHLGDDRLFGGAGDDFIVGGEGNDLLRGSLGYDNLTGNEGADAFVLVLGEVTDTIHDFEIDSDTIVLYGGIGLDDVSIVQIDNNTALSVGDETLAILNGINADDLMAKSDSVFMDA